MNALPRSLVILLPLLFLVIPAISQDSGVLGKREEGKYFVELGEVFLRSDEFDWSPAFFDPDGAGGPAGFEELSGPSDDTFSTDPRVVLGLNRPDGKTTISFTAWEFNAEDKFAAETTVGAQTLVPTMVLPGLTFTRSGGINLPENVFVDQERDFKYLGASFERNFHENKWHRWRYLLGMKYIQFEDRFQANHQYGAQPVRILTEFVEFHDVQNILARTSSKRLGPSVGAESQFKFGKKFRLTSRFEMHVGDESIDVAYRNRAAEVNPFVRTRIINGQVDLTVAGTASPPFGISDSELIQQFAGLQGGFGGMDLRINGDNEQKVVATAEASIRGAFDINRWVQAGIEYRYMHLFDVPSAQLAAEAVRDTIGLIDIDVVGLDTPDTPDDDHLVYNVEHGDIVVRHDVVLDGLNFFFRFNF